MQIILDEYRDNEIAITSNVAFCELTAETYEFVTERAGQQVRIDIHMPFSVHQNAAGADNGAFRIYLDGTGIATSGPAAGKQWDGFMLANGGAWVSASGVPANGRVSCGCTLTIADAGGHTLRVQYAGSKTYTIGTLRSRRFVQVSTPNDNHPATE